MKWRTLKEASLNDIIGWADSQPWCQAMADCDQDAEWHSEGDVWTHTKMVLMQLGKIVQQGGLRDLVQRPASPFVTEFVESQRGPWEALREAIA